MKKVCIICGKEFETRPVYHTCIECGEKFQKEWMK